MNVQRAARWRLVDDGSFWDNFGQSVNPNLKVMVMGEDGKRLEVTGPGAIPLMLELKRLADAAKSKKVR